MEDILDHYGLLKDLTRKEDELVGFRPIHDEKHYNKNAFCANTSKNNWHYFSCRAGGNILDFVVAMENLNIREAGHLNIIEIATKFGGKIIREQEKNKLIKIKK